MDASPLFPLGFHPVYDKSLPSGQGLSWPLSRAHYPVKYYFIDYSISVHIPPDVKPKLTVGFLGRDQEPPELSDVTPYDPFKLDIFILGNMFRKELYNVSLRTVSDNGSLTQSLRNTTTSVFCGQ